jgi:IS30 family transposase
VGFVWCILEVAMRILTPEEREKIVYLYTVEGWSKKAIATVLNIHHSSIDWWIKDMKKAVKKPKHLYTYVDYLKQEEDRKARKRQICSHPQPRLVVICLGCGEHLEETKTRPAKVQVQFL